MSEDRIKDEWPKIADRLRRHWHKLTPADVNVPDGGEEYLAVLLQQRYGIGRREAFQQVFEFECEL